MNFALNFRFGLLFGVFVFASFSKAGPLVSCDESLHRLRSVWSPKSQLFLTEKVVLLGMSNGEILLYRLDQPGELSEVREYNGHKIAVDELIRPGAENLVVSRSEDRVKVWRFDLLRSTLRMLSEYRAKQFRDSVFWAAAVSLDGKYLALGLSRNRVAIVDLETDEAEVFQPRESSSPMNRLFFIGESRQLVVGSTASTSLWRVTDIATTLKTGSKGYTEYALDHPLVDVSDLGNNRVAVLMKDPVLGDTAGVFDFRAGRLLDKRHRFDNGDQPEKTLPSKDGKSFFAYGMRSNRLYRFGVGDSGISGLRVLEKPGRVIRASLSPNGEFLAMLSPLPLDLVESHGPDIQQFHVVSVQDLELVGGGNVQANGRSFPSGVSWSPKGGILMVSNFQNIGSTRAEGEDGDEVDVDPIEVRMLAETFRVRGVPEPQRRSRPRARPGEGKGPSYRKTFQGYSIEQVRKALPFTRGLPRQTIEAYLVELESDPNAKVPRALQRPGVGLTRALEEVVKAEKYLESLRGTPDLSPVNAFLESEDSRYVMSAIKFFHQGPFREYVARYLAGARDWKPSLDDAYVVLGFERIQELVASLKLGGMREEMASQRAVDEYDLLLAEYGEEVWTAIINMPLGVHRAILEMRYLTGKSDIVGESHTLRVEAREALRQILSGDSWQKPERQRMFYEGWYTCSYFLPDDMVSAAGVALVAGEELQQSFWDSFKVFVPGEQTEEARGVTRKTLRIHVSRTLESLEHALADRISERGERVPSFAEYREFKPDFQIFVPAP